MAEGRNPIKRTLEILGGTAVGIGKDYTSNLQDLITDAQSIKSNVIQGANTAKETFERMKNGTGPIKGVLNWFYTKEGETEQWDLDDADSDFDAGTDFGTGDDESEGPGVLNVSEARDLTRGHINSMFKIASKISEAQIANTAEIISTMNSRTSEVVASINNVNSTLVGISKQIDAISKIVTAGFQQPKRGQYDSLLDYNGRLTLGGVFDASKNAVQNSTAATMGSFMKTMFSAGMLTPETVARLAFDMTLGDKKFSALGDKSINEIGEKVNNAIGQGINDALEGIIGNKWFKKLFGDLRSETRSNDFSAYIKNEYTRDAAMFDGMTRKTIVDVIPGYLKLIHEDLSGKQISVNNRGQLVAGPGNTWAGAVSRSLFQSGAGDYDFLQDLSKNKEMSHGLKQRDLNTLNIAVTASLLRWMFSEDVRMLDKRWVSSQNMALITQIASKLDGYIDKPFEFWVDAVTDFFKYTESSPSRLNKFVQDINVKYDSIHRRLENEAMNVNDGANVGSIDKIFNEAFGMFMDKRNKLNQPNPPIPPIPPSPSGNIGGNGDVRFNIYGNGPELGTATHDILSDIRTLLAAGTKKIVGSTKYSSIKLSTTAPIVPDMSTVEEKFENDNIREEKTYDDEEYGGFKGNARGAWSAVKDAARGFKNTTVYFIEGMENTRFGQKASEIGHGIENKLSQGIDAAKPYAQQGWDWTKTHAEQAWGWGKEKAGQAWDWTKGKAGEAKDTVSGLMSDRNYKGYQKAVDMANDLGHSADDEEDRNTVQAITAAMQMAIQNGSASSDEKNTITRMIDSLHNNKLKSKLKRHVNAILDKSSFESKERGESNKKGVLGKILGILGLVVSPIRLLGKLVTFVAPKIFQGGKALFGKVFGNDIRELKSALGALKEERQNFKDLRKQFKEERRTRMSDLADDPNVARNKYVTEGGTYQKAMTLRGALSPITDPIKQRASQFGNWATEKAGTALGYARYYGGELLDKGKELGGKALDGIGYGLGTAYGWGKQAVGQLGQVAGGALDVGKNLLSAGYYGLQGTKLGQKVSDKVGKLKTDDESGGGILSGVGGNLKTFAQQKMTAVSDKFGQLKQDANELKEGFKLGKLEDFKSGFEEAAGIKKPGSIKIDGVDGNPETYSDQVLAQTYGLFTGQKESVLSNIYDYLVNKDKAEEEKADDNAEKDDQQQEAQQDQEANQGEKKDTPGQLVGFSGRQTKGTATMDDLVANANGGSGNESNGETGAVGTEFSEGGEGGSDQMESVSSPDAGGSTGGGGGKSLSTLMKMGQSVGKIVKILGSVGKIIGKILLKAVLMLSGFKALKKTLGSVIPMITKVISIGLRPLNKIFNFLNKTIKPIIGAIKKILSSVMEAISGILTAVFDTLVPILNNVITPVLNALMPMIDMVLDVLKPLFDVITSVVDVVLVPIGGLFKYVLLPIIKQIGDIMKVVMGILELGFGALMVPLGGILTAVGAIAKLFGGGPSLATSGKEMMSTGAKMVVQGLKDIGTGIMAFVSDVVKTITFQDQSEPEQEIKIDNPNAREITSVGSVMDGYASGDVYNDSHNIQNISNIYGSGRAQGSYGGALSMKDNGCGPMALADAYNRRHGTNVDGLAMASSMAKHGTYEPGRGTSVSSFMNTSAALGSGLRAGGVTQSSLKRATPNNPITLVGSGSDFGTKAGNNHYVNVVGTDRYGGAYVSNPLTGRVDRRSASTLASNSLLGLYGSGDVGGFVMPDTVSDALSELKNIAGSLLGMFVTSKSDAMTEQMSAYERESKLENIKDQLNQWFKRKQNDPDSESELPEDFDEEKYSDYYSYVEAKAEELAFEDFKSQNPKKDGESDEVYRARFEKWYTDDKKLKYIGKVPAYQELASNIEKNGTNMEAALRDYDFTHSNTALGQAMNTVSEAADKIEAREDSGGGSSGSGGSGYFTSDKGVKLWTDKYEDNIEITSTDITKNRYNSPLFEFFAKTMGMQLGTVQGSGWYERYNSPNKQGVGQDLSSGQHSGVDFAAGTSMLGKPLYATTDGTVVAVWSPEESGGGGNTVVWRDSAGMLHWYMHMQDIDPGIKKDKKINGGTLIGHVGYTGSVLPPGQGGTHLHYTINDTLSNSGDGNVVNPLMYFNNYNPTGGKSSGNTTEERIWTFLRNNGASPMAAAAIMGNWQVESYNNPNRLEGDYAFGGMNGSVVQQALKNQASLDWYVQNKLFPYYRGPGRTKFVASDYQMDGHFYPGLGLAQWTGGRTRKLSDFTIGKGKRWSDLDAQLQFWKSEIQGAYKSNFMSANKASSIPDAANIILNGYEGNPGNKVSERVQAAADFYSKFKDFTGENKQTSNVSSAQTIDVSDKQKANYEAIQRYDGKNIGNVTGVNADSWLNLRAEPSVDSESIGQYNNGDELHLRATDTPGWFEVVDGAGDDAAHIGYVSADFISLQMKDDEIKPSSSTTSTTKTSSGTGSVKNSTTSGGLDTDISSWVMADPNDPKNQITLVSNNSSSGSKSSGSSGSMVGPINSDLLFDLNSWIFDDPSTKENEGRDQRNYYYSMLADLHKKAEENKFNNSAAMVYATKYNDDGSTANDWLRKYVEIKEEMLKRYNSNPILYSNIVNDYNRKNTKLYEQLFALKRYAASKSSESEVTKWLNNNVFPEANRVKQKNSLNDVNQWMFDNVLAGGDVDTSSLGGFASVMNAFTSTDGDIPDLNADRITSMLNGESQQSTAGVKKYSYTSDSKKQDERLEAILQNTYKVSDERVAALLELILRKMDNRSRTGDTPSMFSNDEIPRAVQRLAK